MVFASPSSFWSFYVLSSLQFVRKCQLWKAIIPFHSFQMTFPILQAPLYHLNYVHLQLSTFHLCQNVFDNLIYWSLTNTRKCCTCNKRIPIPEKMEEHAYAKNNIKIVYEGAVRSRYGVGCWRVQWIGRKRLGSIVMPSPHWKLSVFQRKPYTIGSIDWLMSSI
jgi:hypothetical protein